MFLPIGATVYARDGVTGKTEYVVVDREDHEVTHIIVKTGKVLGREIVVPIGWVENTSDHEVFVNATIAELDALPDYDELHYLKPEVSYRLPRGYTADEARITAGPYEAVGGGKPWIARLVHFGLRDDEALLKRGLPALTRDKQTVGEVDHLVVEPDGSRVTHLVIRKGRLGKREYFLVPITLCTSITGTGVELDLTENELEQMPVYHPPATDEQITSTLQRALETDPRTRTAGLRVESYEGVVRFIGNAPGEVMEAAREIARRIRGVIGFEDSPVTPPSPPLRIGEPVFARDGRIGTLDKVVIDPYTRRVTHLVIHHGWLSDEDRVVPIERVERTELDRIFLDMAAQELKQYPVYCEEAFVKPMESWEAPEPYKHGEALFWGGSYPGVAPPVISTLEHVIAFGIPKGEIVLQRDTNVLYHDKLVGTVDHVLFHPTSGALTHLVVDENDHEKRVIVPAEWIHEIDPEAVILDHWDPDQPGVPGYLGTRDDQAIQAELEARFQTEPALKKIQVYVDRGVVKISGHVQTRDEKDAAVAIARSTPGVIHVEDKLIPEDQGE